MQQVPGKNLRCGRGLRSSAFRAAWGIGASLLVLSLWACSSTPEAQSVEEPKDSATENLGQVEPASAQPKPQASGDAAALTEEMRLQAERRRAEAEYFLQRGNQKFDEADYRAAEELYRRALERDPGLEEAKRRRVTAMMFLGMRDGEIRTAMEQMSQEVGVMQEQRLAEVRQALEEGQEYFDQGDLELSLRAFARARQLLLLFDYGVDTTDLRETAEEKFRMVNQEKARVEERIRQSIEQETRNEANERQTLAERRRRERIDNLLERASQSMREREYSAVVDLASKVLELDPQNQTARSYYRDANELEKALRKVNLLETNREETRRTWEDLREATIPYDTPFSFGDEEHWRTEVRRRAAEQQQFTFTESSEVQKIRQALNGPAPRLDFADNSLDDVVNFLRTYADINIQIDPEIDPEEKRVQLKVEGVKLIEALNLILENTDLAYTFKYDMLYITEKSKAYGNTHFLIYNVADILNRIKDFPGPQIRVRSNDESDEGAAPFGFGDAEEDESDPLTPETLAELVKESTGGEEVWDESGSEIIAHKGQLLITATQELHEQTRDFLQNLRQDTDLFVIVETRFIDMVDDFLEDIGVDSRNLGQPPGTGFGTAFGGGLSSARTGGTDPGFMNLGNPTNPSLLQGRDRTAGRIQHVLDGFIGAAQGSRLNSALRGLTMQVTWLDPFQLNAILRATHEEREARTVTAPRVTASNGQRVHVSVITQRSYVQDYELVSGGTGLVVQEVADPVVATFQDGVILDVRPVISHDRKYITLDVKPTLANLVNGVISSVTVSLGSLVAAATLVEIDLPEISLQQAFTSVTVPDGGTVLLGGFRSMNERKYESFVPFVGRLPLVKNAFRRKAYLSEQRSLYILLTAKIVDLRAEEKELFNR